MILAVDEPPSCAFHILVIEDFPWRLIQHALRYSSETDGWEALEVDDRRPLYQTRNITLAGEFLWYLNGVAKTLDVYHPDRGAGVISRVKTVDIPCTIADPRGINIVRYDNRLYGISQRNSSPFHDLVQSIGVWEVDLAEGTWVHVSTSPTEVMEDFRTRFPRRYLHPSFERANVMADMLVVQVLLKPLCPSSDDIETLEDYPAQDLYYRFADKRWFSGSRFFCFQGSKCKGCSGKTLLVKYHDVFHPMLALRL